MGHGVLAAPDERAAAAGASMLQSGGNAVDAAVAAAFAIGVVEPYMSGLGGGAWLVASLRDVEEHILVEGPITSPLAATPDMFRLVVPEQTTGLYGWPAVEDDANLWGPRSVGVPGAVAALCLAQRRLGLLSLKQVLAPAVALADGGIDVNWFTSSAIVQEARQLARDPGCADMFLPDGFALRPPGFAPGDRLHQPALARTLDAVAHMGHQGFYEGPTAERLVEHVRAGGGLLSLADLANYRARISRAPVVGTFRGANILGTQFTGTPTVVQALNVFEIASTAVGEAGAADDVALAWAEALRLAHLDRMTWMTANPDVPVPWQTLMSRQYAHELWRSRTTHSAPPDPSSWDDHVPGGAAPATPSEPSRWGCTSHISVVDRFGNMVALTQTILDHFGARLLEPETGVLLNDGMTYFDPRPGHRNSIHPGVPGLPAVSPVIVEVPGQGPIAAVGGAGGRKIISSTAQVLSHIVQRMAPQEAIDEPRVHADGDTALVDARWPAAAAERIRHAGLRTEVVTEEPTTWHFARMGAVAIGVDGIPRGGVDRSKPGAVTEA